MLTTLNLNLKQMTFEQAIEGQQAQIAYIKDEQNYKNLADDNESKVDTSERNI